MSTWRDSDVHLGLVLDFGVRCDKNMTASLDAGPGLGLGMGVGTSVGMDADNLANLFRHTFTFPAFFAYAIILNSSTVKFDKLGFI